MNHWSLLFATPLFAYLPPSFASFTFYTPYLLVPFAALLGQRYGVSGVVAIALGGLVFVVSISGTLGAFGGSPALYLIALAVAAVAASPRPLVDCLRWPEEDRAAWWLSFAAPFLLVLYAGAGSGPGEGGVRVAFVLSFSLLGYFLLFVLGVRGVRVAALVLGLAVAAVLSWALILNGFVTRLRSPMYITNNPLYPSTVLAAIAMVSAGAATRAFLSGSGLSKFWRRPYWAVTALVFLWFGPPPIAAIRVDLEFVRYINILQVAVALPLAAFMAGLLRGARGTIFVTSLVTALTLVWIVVVKVIDLGTALNFNVGQIALEAPFVAAAFGVMGARAAMGAPAESRSESADFSSLRLPTLIFFLFVIVLGVALDILDEGGPVRTALAALFVLAVIAASFGAWRLYRAMAARGFSITSERWAPFVAILGVVYALAGNLQAVWGQVKQLFVLVLLPLSLFSSWAREVVRDFFGGRIDGETLAWLLFAAAVWIVGAIVAIRTLVRVAPKISGDARKIAAFIRERRQGRAASAPGG